MLAGRGVSGTSGRRRGISMQSRWRAVSQGLVLLGLGWYGCPGCTGNQRPSFLYCNEGACSRRGQGSLYE